MLPRGTSVVVRNLFFNTPARRKFLRTDRTEAARVAEVIEVLAIAHPAIGFTLRVDGQPRLDLPPAAAARERALQVLGGELEEQLLTLEESAHGLELWGLIGTPELARATGRHLKVFLNGRPISDRTISHAVREAFRGLIAPDRSPTAVLMVRIDPKHVDVNVHPAKAEVRFRDQSHVHGTVQRAVVRVLRGADLVPSLDALGSAEPKPFGSGLGGGGRGGSRELLEHFRGLDPASKGFIYQQVRDALRAESPELLEQGQGSTAATIDASAPLVAVTRAERVLQVHGCYLVAEDEQGLVIIDQHALHERVMFEQLKQRVSEGSLESQRLLLPATVEVEETQVAALASLKPLLERLGIDAEPIGPRTVAVHAFTSLLFERNVTPEPFLREILDSAEELSEQDDPEAALHRVLDMMACKAAIKAGDRLSGAEMEDLLRQRAQIDRSSRCPHGRPTTLRLTLADLDRQFGRSSRAGS